MYERYVIASTHDSPFGVGALVKVHGEDTPSWRQAGVERPLLGSAQCTCMPPYAPCSPALGAGGRGGGPASTAMSLPAMSLPAMSLPAQ